MKNHNITIPAILFLVLSAVLISGCLGEGTMVASPWSITINGNATEHIDSTLYARLVNCSQTYNGVTDIPVSGGIPLEYFLAYYGVYPVTSVSFNGTTYNWTSVVYQSDKDDTPLVTPNGSLYYRGQWAHVNNVNVTVTDKASVSTLDVEPSILYALGATEKPGILPQKADRVVLVYIDAFGYQRYEDSAKLGIVDNLSALGEPIKAMCVYPSVSQVNSKAMVTGMAPNLSQGNFRSYFPTSETMFDILREHGKTAVWVGGSSAPVYINGSVLNSDKNGDGIADDEAADVAIAQYKAGADLVVVHFDSTDSVMHQMGPGSAQAEAAVKRADELVGHIESSLDKGTVLIVWSDHGCHVTKDGGDHGTLIPDDMYVPIFVHYV